LNCNNRILQELSDFDPKLELLSRLRDAFTERRETIDDVIMQYLDDAGGILLPESDEGQGNLMQSLGDAPFVFGTLVLHCQKDNPNLAFLLVAYGAALTLTAHGQAPWNRMVKLAHELDTAESENPE
jgi:hypothetical protein